MPRPAKILEDTKTYNLLMTHSARLQKTNRGQVAVADLIRDAIDVYIEVLDEEEYEEN
jgi:hypothetical protein